MCVCVRACMCASCVYNIPVTIREQLADAGLSCHVGPRVELSSSAFAASWVGERLYPLSHLSCPLSAIL